MNLDKVTAGAQVPDQINVIIEIPLHSDPVKYEVNKDTGAMFVDRFLTTPMRYPCNYGYVPCTLSQDGDPADVLVIAPFPIITGAVISVRPIGLLRMTDESGPDAKLLAVPVDKLSPIYRNIHSYQEVCPHLLGAVTHFFEHYKDLEAHKWVKIDGWEDVEAAKKEISESIARYEEVFKAGTL